MEVADGCLRGAMSRNAKREREEDRIILPCPLKLWRPNASIQFLTPPSCYCCFPLDTGRFRSERRFLNSLFVSLGNTTFVSRVTGLGQ